ncbi:FliI/YscN family ATPase [Roseateles sp.]|uniref:FliI/YscN family ATPase n=1 Tax=Roseateles sp. TaxID=1971397 RepID=UPI0031E19648
MSSMEALLDATRQATLERPFGRLRGVSGLTVTTVGPGLAMGDLCEVLHEDGRVQALAEVVAVRGQDLTLMPFGDAHGMQAGARVRAAPRRNVAEFGPALLGRVIDGLGEPLDGFAAPRGRAGRPLRAPAPDALTRPRIERPLETGVRALDAMLPLGHGQRVGIFAGSGVGKSTLLGMMARHARADYNVIALIGERGREVREFIEDQLGQEGLARSVVVVATSDQPAPMRVRAAYLAVSIAEGLRHQGADVLLTMDSITRLAMARREIGLSAGEPPTARGYTPSVFSELPALCERLGTLGGGGSITGLLTVLVEGDDFNEPISDCLRATLDGHIVLTRELAHQGHYPAIDVLKSSSRLLGDLLNDGEQRLVHRVRAGMALLSRNRPMMEIGAYEKGSHAALDRAIAAEPALQRFLRQESEPSSREEALQLLADLAKAFGPEDAA